MGFQINPPQIHETVRGGGDRNWSCGRRSTPIIVPAARSTYRMVPSELFVEPSKRMENLGADWSRCGGAGRRRRRFEEQGDGGGVRPRAVEQEPLFSRIIDPLSLVMIRPVSASEPDLNPRRAESRRITFGRLCALRISFIRINKRNMIESRI